mgnify:CR=1 FL=1
MRNGNFVVLNDATGVYINVLILPMRNGNIRPAGAPLKTFGGTAFLSYL